MFRPKLEVADIFRDYGAAWRSANAGHVARCEDCAHTLIACNSCRNGHCPKCQGAAAREWLAEREAELLPVPYFHVVYTLPAELRDIAYQNKTVVYDLLFKVSAETTLTIGADLKHLRACTGLISVLHTWGSALVHHPHVHMIVPGIAVDRLSPALFLDGRGFLGALTPIVPGDAARGACGRTPAVLRRPCHSPTRLLSELI
jgi:Transposase zinc-binding domain/Putative transposase